MAQFANLIINDQYSTNMIVTYNAVFFFKAHKNCFLYRGAYLPRLHNHQFRRCVPIVHSSGQAALFSAILYGSVYLLFSTTGLGGGLVDFNEIWQAGPQWYNSSILVVRLRKMAPDRFIAYSNRRKTSKRAAIAIRRQRLRFLDL